MPSASHDDAGGRHDGVEHGDDDERDRGADAAEDREQRHVDAADADVAGPAVRPLDVGQLRAQAHDREVRDRERQHRAEGVHLAQEVGLAGQQRQHRDAAEDDDPQPRRAVARMQPPQPVGHLAVDAHRVHEPRDADQAGVRRDEEDRRGEQADVELARALQRAEVDRLDDAEDRIAGVAALVLRQAEQRLVLAGALVERHRQRRQRDGRQREVDREDGEPDAADRGRDRLGLVLGLLGEVRDRLDAGVGDHAERDREQEVRPRRRDAEMDVVDERRGTEHEHDADDHEQQLGHEVDDRERDVQAGGLLDAAHVDRAPAAR